MLPFYYHLLFLVDVNPVVVNIGFPCTYTGLQWAMMLFAVEVSCIPSLVRVSAPFRDGISNRCLVSEGDRGVLPTWPRNRRGYALLAHTFGKMRSCATGERSNTEIRTLQLKIQLYGGIVSGLKYIPHSQPPLNVYVRMYIPHSRSKENVSVHRYIAHNFSR